MCVKQERYKLRVIKSQREKLSESERQILLCKERKIYRNRKNYRVREGIREKERE